MNLLCTIVTSTCYKGVLFRLYWWFLNLAGVWNLFHAIVCWSLLSSLFPQGIWCTSFSVGPASYYYTGRIFQHLSWALSTGWRRWIREYLLLIEDSVVYLEERTWLLQDMSLRVHMYWCWCVAIEAEWISHGLKGYTCDSPILQLLSNVSENLVPYATYRYTKFKAMK